MRLCVRGIQWSVGLSICNFGRFWFNYLINARFGTDFYFWFQGRNFQRNFFVGNGGMFGNDYAEVFQVFGQFGTRPFLLGFGGLMDRFDRLFWCGFYFGFLEQFNDGQLRCLRLSWCVRHNCLCFSFYFYRPIGLEIQIGYIGFERRPLCGILHKFKESPQVVFDKITELVVAHIAEYPQEFTGLTGNLAEYAQVFVQFFTFVGLVFGFKLALLAA